MLRNTPLVVVSLFLCLLLGFALRANGQRLPTTGGSMPTGSNVSFDNQGRPVRARSQGQDSLKRRDNNEDSITIRYKMWDSSRLRNLDSSLNDWATRWPVPATYVDIGNNGNAARNLLFTPLMQAGFDAGFHAFDVYRLKIEDTRFYTTTRPHTELAYILGPKAEQYIDATHTQNRNANFNFAFQYRLINSPGAFKNQNTAHNGIRLNAHYTSPNKRYSNYFIFISNSIRSSENGGLKNPSQLNALQLNDPFELETRLGTLLGSRRNPFNVNIITGTLYNERKLLFRQNYDFGQKDSLVVNDTTTVKLFYPRFRLQHTLTTHSHTYTFRDQYTDSASYALFFNKTVGQLDTLTYDEQWNDVSNELAIISYPEKKNLNQYIKLGAGLQLLTGKLATGTARFTNLYALAEYRNLTRNKKWELNASGVLYTGGVYAGNYQVQANIKSLLGKKLGYITLGAINVNRTPSHVFGGNSSFPTVRNAALQNENTSQLYAVADNPLVGVKLTARYYLLSNYTYLTNFYNVTQERTLFNVLVLGIEKKIKISRRINWYAEAYLQQATSGAPVNLPLFFTRNRFVFEGQFFKNLHLATGLEIRYYTNYKPADYSPLTGQFFYQNTVTVNNRPDANLFLHFRIRTFKGFIRMENINSLNIGSNSGFNERNFTAPFYAGNTLWFRAGVYWSFIN
jgi:hypothetical protein